MKKLAQETKKSCLLPAQANCEKSQDVNLNRGMPVTAKINNHSKIFLIIKDSLLIN